MLLLADSAPAAGGDAANRPMPFEATTLLAALATMTSRIGLVAAASTIAHQPYNLARRFASLDIISHGRAGWNATMMQGPQEAANFCRPGGFSSGDFRRRTEEYIDIVQGLWRMLTRCCSTKAAVASTIQQRCICSTTRASSFRCA
jgi:alkanesulfonate monooxygenase SsuD/methylene tetrahydromethanopterin reductase-like flavin-dependent oxidoreductase (luciferase family)